MINMSYSIAPNNSFDKNIKLLIFDENVDEINHGHYNT